MACMTASGARAGALIAVAALALSGCKRSELADSPRSQVEIDDASTGESATESDESEAPERGDSATTITEPFLWEVTGPEGEQSGTLFGTMHMGVDAEASLPEIVWERLDASDIFTMETDLSDMSVAQQLMRSDGTTLSDEIGEDAWATLVDIVGGFQARGIDQMKAGGAAMAVIAAPLPSTPPMDLVLLQKANEANLEVVYLEEASFQMDLLLRFITTDVLLELLEDYDQVVEMSERGLEAYLAGDEEALTEYLLDPANWEPSPEGAQEAFLDERNEAWVPQIEEMLERGTPFVAVGAGHLVGENSVIDLLTRRGYEVQRLGAD